MRKRTHLIASLLLPIVALMLANSMGYAQTIFQKDQNAPALGGETTIGNSSVVVRTVTGTVDVNKRYLNLMDDIYRNELIKTFDDSATEITFLDETTLTLGPDTSIVLDRFIYDPDKTTNEFVISVTQGVFRFATGTMQNEAYKVRTPVATIGIRGTVIEVAVEKMTGGKGVASVELRVLEGEAYLTPCNGERIVVLQGSTAAFGPKHECP